MSAFNSQAPSYTRNIEDKATSANPLEPLMVSSLQLAVFLVAHVALALLARQSSAIASAHAYVTLAVALLWAATKTPTHRIAYAIAYITGAEVFWRMTEARVFWEFGKYAVVAVLLMTFFRIRVVKIPLLPFLYFLLLLPSAVQTIAELPLNTAREQISFNLSGPLAVLICAVFFRNIHLTQAQIKTMLLSLVLPITAIATVALAGIVTAPSITWVNDSNFATSGGFGPNQVSSALGLGALSLWLMLLLGTPRHRLLLLILSLWLLIQAMLTFSRGGVLNVVVAMLGVILYLWSQDRERLGRLLPVAAILLLVAYAVFPVIDSATNNMLSVRFSDTNLTNRDEIARANFELFSRHPITGVGVGLAPLKGAFRAAAHTEFTRLLAEHGVLGLLSLGLLILAATRNLAHKRLQTNDSVLLIAAALWSLAFMTNAAMRTVAPSLMIGLTFMANSSKRESEWRQ